MSDNFITREEFREFFKEQREDFRDALQNAVKPLVERIDRQNGRVTKLEDRLSSVTKWQEEIDVKAKLTSGFVKQLWAAGGGGLLVWIADKLLSR